MRNAVLPVLRRRRGAPPAAARCGCRIQRRGVASGSASAGSAQPPAGSSSSNFIHAMVERDVTPSTPAVLRFPPEPNGQLHIGHAKAICLNFGLAAELHPHAVCNLRFDDTNPAKATSEHMRAIKRDISWLGYTWHGEAKFASDYFETLHELAVSTYPFLLVISGPCSDRLLVVPDGADRGREGVCLRAPARGGAGAARCAPPARAALAFPGAIRRRKPRSLARDAAWVAPRRLARPTCQDRPPRCNSCQYDHTDPAAASEFASILTDCGAIAVASPNLRMRDPVMYRIRHQTHARVASGELAGQEWCDFNRR